MVIRIFLLLLICTDSFAESLQRLVVSVPQAQSQQGELRCFERRSVSQNWQQKGKAIPVVVGKNGITSNKKEGDLKTPTGIFLLGSAFGFNKILTDNTHYPYIPLNARTLCVDNIKSPAYNHIVQIPLHPHKELTGELMSKVLQYEKGIVVRYNMPNPIPGKGSCIFIHIWENKQKGTSGCIAMERKNLEQILTWLDKKKDPTIWIKAERSDKGE